MTNTQLNVTEWAGWEWTFGDPERYHAIHTKKLSIWPINGTHVDAVARRRAGEKNPDSYLSVGERVREVYHSCLQFESPEHEWEFARILGCGSFGLASLWQRWDEHIRKDELVTKSETPQPRLAVNLRQTDISKEAFHLAQLNERTDQQGNPRVGVVRLRGFRAISGCQSTQADGHQFEPDPLHEHVEQPLYREWRTFMENCSYGTLSRIILTYKAWGYHVPEAFVWWTFLWLMEACKAMDQEVHSGFHRCKSDGSTPCIVGSFMLSNDIKPDNIFVGGSREDHEYAPGAPFDMIPAARMGDFGLSKLTSFDEGNRPGRFPLGTPLWMSPERREVSMGVDCYAQNNYLFYRQARVDPPTWNANRGVPKNTQSHCIGPESNVWSAAMAVYVLMTLEDIRDIDEIVNEKISLNNYRRDDDTVDQYLFELENFATFLEDKEDYSDELKYLVQQCTRMEPTKRPDIDTILANIHAGIKREHDRLHSEFDDDGDIYDATRMAFTNEDWHDVPEGPYPMMTRLVPGAFWGGARKAWHEWREFHHTVEEWNDADTPTLVPPRQYKIYQQGDAHPAYWTAKNPEPEVGKAMTCPYYGGDFVLYVEEDFIKGYHQGRPLPPGGRVWKSQMDLEA